MTILRIIFFIFFILHVPVILGNAADMETDLRTQFFRAGEVYKEEKYQEAAELYEDILAKGYESGPLYYNLGNSYLKDNKLGRAILNYERAGQLMPRDSDLNTNERYALSLVQNYQEPQKTIFNRLFDDFENNFTLDELTWVCVTIFILMGALYLAGLWLEWPWRKISVFECFLGALLIFNLISLTMKWQYHEHAAVVVEESEAKYEPTKEGTTYFKLPEGFKIIILNNEGDWSKIKRLDGKTGWIQTATIKKI